MTLPTSTYSAASADLPLLHNAQDSAQSDSAKSSLTPAACSRTDSQGSQTSETLGEPNLLLGLEISPFLPGDFPANHGALPGSEKAQQTTAISGRQCLALSKLQGRAGCLAKMCLTWKGWGASTLRSMIWRPSVTRSGRLLFLLSPQAKTTCDLGFGHSGMIPTPTATDHKGASMNPARFARRGHKSNLRDWFRYHYNAVYPAVEAVEYLMGYPIGHTALKDSATPLSRKSRNRSSTGSRKSKGAS